MRNLMIFFAAVIEEKPLSDIAREYKISPSRVKQIVLVEAKKRAPKLYKDLSSARFNYCRVKDNGQGPSMFELKKFKDQFVYGDA